MRNRPATAAVAASCVAFALSLAAFPRTLLAGKPDSPPDVVEVKIKNLTFIPETVTIKAGQTIRWINMDDRDYLLVARDQSFKSDEMRPKEKFEHKFTDVGSVEYACALHPRLIGTVVVQAAN